MWESIIIVLINVILYIVSILFLKNYFPKYMAKKGENLATKEDIQEITRLTEKGKNLATKEDIQEITKKTEQVKIFFEKEITDYNTHIAFTQDYTFKRYSILYSKIYAIIIQSEYSRFFHKKTGWDNIEHFPFFETEKKRAVIQIDTISGESVTEEYDMKDEMTAFNKKQLVDYIIQYGEYASPKLLKIAVAYRYVWYHYSGTSTLDDKILQTKFDISELKLLFDLVNTIIIEFNELRRTLNIDYNNFELENGILETNHFK